VCMCACIASARTRACVCVLFPLSCLSAPAGGHGPVRSGPVRSAPFRSVPGRTHACTLESPSRRVLAFLVQCARLGRVIARESRSLGSGGDAGKAERRSYVFGSLPLLLLLLHREYPFAVDLCSLL
jgi:hypothetical protein